MDWNNDSTKDWTICKNINLDFMTFVCRKLDFAMITHVLNDFMLDTIEKCLFYSLISSFVSVLHFHSK